MITFIATIHILACLALIALVLLQDSKGGGVFSSQSSSNSVLGAASATSLANTLTKIVSAILVATCIILAMMSAKSQKSVVDSGVLPVNQPTGQPAQQTLPVENQPTPPSAPQTQPQSSDSQKTEPQQPPAQQ